MGQDQISVRFPNGNTAVVPGDTQIVYIATIPRSGTRFLHYLLEYFYSSLDPRYQPEHRISFKHYPVIKLAKLQIHSTCPGFKDCCVGPLREQWDSLLVEPQFDSDYVWAELNKGLVAPHLTDRARIVFLYRNPLDQSVSLLNHLKGHSELSGFAATFKDAGDFMRRSNLDSYLKQYVSFAQMQMRYPKSVLNVSYEALYERTGDTIESILSFIGMDSNGTNYSEAIREAVERTSVCNIRALERSLGRSLASDQIDPGASHIKHGQRSLWQRELDRTSVEYARQRLRMFDLNLDDFAL